MEQERKGPFGPQVNHPPPPRRDGGSSRSTPQTFHSILQGQQQGNPAKELIHPGSDVKEMLMRTYLEDANEARDVALTLAKCDEFGMEEEKNLILYLLAARNSIRGRGQIEYLQGIVGILSPSMLGYKGAKVHDHNKRSGDGDQP